MNMSDMPAGHDHSKMVEHTESMKKQLAEYPDICIVSGEKLVEDETMNFIHEGHLVRFCCKSCKSDFLKDPETYLEKLAQLKEKN